MLVTTVDQFTKLWALSALGERGSVEVLGRFLMFSLVFNEGGAMGTKLGPSLTYLIVSFIVLPIVLFYIYRNRFHNIVAYPLAFIAGGAVGNMVDRLRLGRVVDFVDVDFFDIHWGGFHITRWWTFNVADAAISCAIVFLIGYMLFQKKSLDPEKERAVDPPPDSPDDSPAR